MSSNNEPSDSQMEQAAQMVEQSMSATVAGGLHINTSLQPLPNAPPAPSYGPALSTPLSLVEASPYGLQPAPGLPLPPPGEKQGDKQYKNGLGAGNDPWKEGNEGKASPGADVNANLPPPPSH